VTDVYATQLGKDRAAQLGKLAWKAMGKLAPSKSNPSQATNYGGRLSTAGTALDVTGRSHALITGADGAKTLVRQGGAQHAAPLFEGAMRNQQTYARATQAFTGTMRTISTSQPNGWIHPGYAGAHLLPEVENYIRRVAPSMVELVMQRMGQPNV
jgi:hypothetical protein